MGRIKNIDGKVDKILTAIDKGITYKAQKYDEMNQLLKNVKLNVDIKPFVNNHGEKEYLITYTTKTILAFDEDGELIDNYLFRAINLLNLVDISDLNKFLEIVEKEKRTKK